MTTDQPRKTRSDSVLGKLSEADQKALFALLMDERYSLVQARLSAPPPKGPGINVSITALQRFFTKCMAAELRKQREEHIDEFNAAAKEINSGPSPYFTIARELIEHRLITLAGHPESSADSLIQMTDLLLRIRRLDLREREQSKQLERASARAEAPNVHVRIHPPVQTNIKSVLANALTPAEEPKPESQPAQTPDPAVTTPGQVETRPVDSQSPNADPRCVEVRSEQPADPQPGLVTVLSEQNEDENSHPNDASEFLRQSTRSANNLRLSILHSITQ
ncbi:MAG TPA: hypothetical protein VEH27_02550 [Methylomirabilota bacterium]|nr:hypothetical protein [Methylomirabilota bacterium]